MREQPLSEKEDGERGAHARLLDQLTDLARRVAQDAGLELVELTLRGPSRRRLLRLDIDRPGPRGVGLEDCQRMSERLGEALEPGELLDGSYLLEVSSPGVDRPIRTPDDVRRNVGRRIAIRVQEPIAGRHEFVGTLAEPTADGLRLREDDGSEIEIPLDDTVQARQDVQF